jgi:hypothetical protein
MAVTPSKGHAMSTILASAATLLALIFSAPVLCAPAARAPAVTSSAAAVLPGRYQLDDGTDGETELLLCEDGSFQHGATASGTWRSDDDTITLAGNPPAVTTMTLRSDGVKLRPIDPAG